MEGAYIFSCIMCVGCILKIDAVTQDFYWRNYIPGDIPYDAVPGPDGLYIGQVNKGGDIPATIYTHSNTAVAEQIGKHTFTDNIKILCSPYLSKFYWEDVNFNENSAGVMKNAVKGGNQAEYNLFIGKVYIDNEWKISKVVPIDITPLKGLHIWDKDGKIAIIYRFHMLKYNITTVSANVAIVCHLSVTLC